MAVYPYRLNSRHRILHNGSAWQKRSMATFLTLTKNEEHSGFHVKHEHISSLARQVSPGNQPTFLMFFFFRFFLIFDLFFIKKVILFIDLSIAFKEGRNKSSITILKSQKFRGKFLPLTTFSMQPKIVVRIFL